MSDTTCDECGFSYESLGPADLPPAIRAFGRRYRAPLTRFLPGEDGDALVRQRPDDETFSAVEHAAHIRDLFSDYTGWIELTVAEDRPMLERPEPEKLGDIRNYGGEDPEKVADALAANAERLAETLDNVPDDKWDRVGMRDDEEQSILTTARQAVHEGGHRLLVIGRTMRAVRDQRGADA